MAEPVLFDDSGRHVDMTEIIENLYIGTQWVFSCPAHVDVDVEANLVHLNPLSGELPRTRST